MAHLAPSLPERASLKAALLAFARHGLGDFDALALDLVRYQAHALPAYGRLLRALHPAAPDLAAALATLTSWEAAPLVPTELFQELDLTSLPPSPADTVFRTSGTTAGRRGQRRVPDLDLYRAAMARPFIHAVLDGDPTPIRWVSFIPHRTTLPDSSLSFMVSELAPALASESYWLVGSEGLDRALAERALLEGPALGDAPLLILATSFALAEFLSTTSRISKLPPHSRLMLTGGFKGRVADLDEPALHAAARDRLGLAPDAIISEYGMTELSSQAYGTPLAPMPTLRFRIVHPELGHPLPAGDIGLVAAFDLLNLDNVSAILTSDLGSLDASGRLTLHGRLPGATPRGCSLSAEELLRRAPELRA